MTIRNSMDREGLEAVTAGAPIGRVAWISV